ncbi:MAG: hypothetical protein AAF532_02845 [Planctomycetota bacterium]
MTKLRFRSGQVQLRRVPVGAATVIGQGDLIYLDVGAAKPAGDFPWDTDLATTQGGFAAAFLGVAHSPSADGDTEDVSVDVSPTSVYEFDVTSAAYAVGATLGPADGGSSTLASASLSAAGATSAVGVSAEAVPGGSTKLRVQFASAFHPGSSNVNAAVG